MPREEDLPPGKRVEALKAQFLTNRKFDSHSSEENFNELLDFFCWEIVLLQIELEKPYIVRLINKFFK